MGSASALGGLRYIENSTEDEENAKHKKGQVNRLAEQEKATLTCIVTRLTFFKRWLHFVSKYAGGSNASRTAVDTAVRKFALNNRKHQ